MTSSDSRRAGRPRGQQGRDLLATARETFLRQGFDGTTMHDIAARAGVSKTSLYREYPSKDALFVAVVTDWAHQGRGAMRPHLEALLSRRDLARALEDFAALLLEAVLSPQVMRMRRLVAAESERFPETARQYYDASWRANIDALADTLATLGTRGDLAVDEPGTAAEQLVWLTVGGPLNRQTLCGGHLDADEAELTDQVRYAVNTFLARYGV